MTKSACHTDLHNHSTPCLSVDQHDLGVNRHSSGTDNDSTFDKGKSSDLNTKTSTTDNSVNEQWTDVEITEVHGTSKQPQDAVDESVYRNHLQQWCPIDTTTCVNRHPTQAELEFLNRAGFRVEFTSNTQGTTVTSPTTHLLLDPPLKR